MPGYNPDDYNLAGAFAEIEHELMESMMRNMRRHQKEEEQEGFEWSQWQAEQLRDLERYRLENKDKFTEDFKAINDMIADMIRQARATGKADEEISILEAIQMGWNRGKKKKGVSGEFFKQNDRKMNALIKATTQDMEKAEHAILRKANDEYRKTIFNAVAIANTGSLGYDKCIDIATRDMRRAGLRCVEYKNGSRHSLEDYADMVIKTTTKRAYLTGEGEMRAEWGISTVILNKRSSACPLCLPWVGKVMIDDVWSNGGKGDGKYPLLSHAIAEGLYHPRCKDSHTTFFPGISTEDSKWTKKELQQLEEENKTEAKQKEAERQAKVHEREAEFAIDPEEKQNRQSMAEQSQRQADLEAEKLVRIAEGYEEETIPRQPTDMAERRKQRLAERKAQKGSRPVAAQGIYYDDGINEKQREIIEQLAEEYKTRLNEVLPGAKKAAGEVTMSGTTMRLSSKSVIDAIHEFAHTLANSSADKYGLTHDQEFWDEIKRIRREYRKSVGDDTSRWISSYEHSSRSVDEFFAEAFAHAKASEMGIDLPKKYGSDSMYSQQVLDAVNKYFKKVIAKPEETGYNNTPLRKSNKELAEVYNRSVEQGWISALCGLRNYVKQYNLLYDSVVGTQTIDGVTVLGVSDHFMDRVIGTAVDPKIFKEQHRKISRSGVPVEDIFNTLKSGVSRAPIQNQKTGEYSQTYYGKKSVVTINPVSGILIQCNPN